MEIKTVDLEASVSFTHSTVATERTTRPKTKVPYVLRSCPCVKYLQQGTMLYSRFRGKKKPHKARQWLREISTSEPNYSSSAGNYVSRDIPSAISPRSPEQEELISNLIADCGTMNPPYFLGNVHLKARLKLVR